MFRSMMLILALAISSSAYAESLYVEATVTSVTPRYVTEKQPVEVCTQVVARYRQPARDGSGAGLGAIMGGMFGMLGGTPGTVAGASLGAALGDQEEAAEVAAGVPVPVYERHCEMEWREVRQVIVNYRIEYTAMGNRYVTYEHFIPGPTMRVRVDR